MKASIIKAACLAIATAGLCACGSSPSSIFKNATFSTFPQNGDQYLQLETDVSSSNVVFSGVTLPVVINSKTIGDVEVATDLTTGTSSIIIQLDLSSVLHLPTLTYSGNLPNGLAWPVTGVDLTKMIAFPVGTNGSRVYLYYDSTAKQAMLGTALTISSLSTGTPASLFANFSVNSITGLVGLYTGPSANTSGVAFLANVSAAMPSWLTLTPSATARVAVRTEKSVTPSKIQFFSTSPDRATRDQIDWELYKMNERHQHITLR